MNEARMGDMAIDVRQNFAPHEQAEFARHVRFDPEGHPLTAGDELRHLRQSKGGQLSVKEFAAAIGYTRPYISAVETGQVEVSDTVRQRYADFFQLSPDEITKYFKIKRQSVRGSDTSVSQALRSEVKSGSSESLTQSSIEAYQLLLQTLRETGENDRADNIERKLIGALAGREIQRMIASSTELPINDLKKAADDIQSLARFHLELLLGEGNAVNSEKANSEQSQIVPEPTAHINNDKVARGE